jgi:SHS family sialic acid transporter-like MFS transporter
MQPSELTAVGRHLILWAGFLGWMFSGFQMTLTNLASGSATEEFAISGMLNPQGFDFRQLAAPLRLHETHHEGPLSSELRDFLKRQKPRWYSYYNCAFLLGAAFGGLAFGWFADRNGRVRAMGISILCYSAFAGLGYFAGSPEQLLVMRFLSGMGVGGMWPTGVSLASEAWSDASRPTLAGLLGTAANVGIVAMSAITYYVPLTPESWRWVMLVGLTPAVLGLFVLLFVPESPAWLLAKDKKVIGESPGSLRTLFTPPLLRVTLLGIALGTIPLLGGWGVTNWLIAWTESANNASLTETLSATTISQNRAITAIMRASGGTLGSLFGGWIANYIGRRTAFFLISLCSFGMSEFIYLRMHPDMPGFALTVFAVGCISTIFFGWLPLYLPELFPTHARATGAGISFNFGRILTAVGVFFTGAIVAAFDGDYAKSGAIMSLIYAAGMVIILFAPDTTHKRLVA